MRVQASVLMLTQDADDSEIRSERAVTVMFCRPMPERNSLMGNGKLIVRTIAKENCTEHILGMRRINATPHRKQKIAIAEKRHQACRQGTCSTSPTPLDTVLHIMRRRYELRAISALLRHAPHASIIAYIHTLYTYARLRKSPQKICVYV